MLSRYGKMEKHGIGRDESLIHTLLAKVEHSQEEQNEKQKK